jgi:hypothetical protein
LAHPCARGGWQPVRRCRFPANLSPRGENQRPGRTNCGTRCLLPGVRASGSVPKASMPPSAASAAAKARRVPRPSILSLSVPASSLCHRQGKHELFHEPIYTSVLLAVFDKHDVWHCGALWTDAKPEAKTKSFQKKMVRLRQRVVRRRCRAHTPKPHGSVGGMHFVPARPYRRASPTDHALSARFPLIHVSFPSRARFRSPRPTTADPPRAAGSRTRATSLLLLRSRSRRSARRLVRGTHARSRARACVRECAYAFARACVCACACVCARACM